MNTGFSKSILVAFVSFSFLLEGCSISSRALSAADVENQAKRSQVEKELAEATLAAEQAELFRRAETERASRLHDEIDRLQADLRAAESALVEAESGLAGSHTRAEAISSLAVTRIQVERAAMQAPWRREQVELARKKLSEAKRQVDEARFGAALFFVYRARRVAESILAEAEKMADAGNTRLIQSDRVNLRAGPSTSERILATLHSGTPVSPQTTEGDWILVQVIGGPAGWIYERLLGETLKLPDVETTVPAPVYSP